MRAPPPTGSVTLVFTDIESSTVLWERAPELMRAALELHDACMRETLDEYGGYEVRTEGDAFKVAFGTPADAVRWSLAVQRRLQDLPWPEGLADQPEAADVKDAQGELVLRGLRVRMGGHTGFPEAQVHPTTGRMEYHGPMVNETARIAAAPHGGQVVFSAMSWEAARRAADLSDVDCRDLGMHRLKGVAEPEHLLELRAPGLVGRSFAALRTETVRRTNLQRLDDPFVGRADEFSRLESTFADGARLVTLLGPGGTGKTRLATEYALAHQDDYTAGGGVWFCDLEEAVDLAAVCSTVARALSLPMNQVSAPNDMAVVVGRALHGLSPIFLVLDNLEQVVDGGREAVKSWMSQAPEARFLITSREPLDVVGEQQVALGGLSPADARQLFVDRVTRVKPSFSPGSEDEAAIADVARQLDFMPLALELAASRANVLSPSAIAKRLDQRFRLLAARRGADSRQGTLRATIDWSWNLLDEAERVALAQCSVFAGGFTMEAAEAVLDLDDIEGSPWPMDVVASLQQKSLLFSRDQGGEVRLGMYQSIQAYARERLAEMGDGPARLAERHAAYYAEAGASWRADIDTERELAVHRTVHLETENLRAAHRASQGSDAARACDIVFSLACVLAHSGPGAWFERLLEDATEAARGLDDPALLAGLLIQRARVHRIAARPDPARRDATEAAAIAHAAGLPKVEADALLGVGVFHFWSSTSKDEARAVYERAIELSSTTGDRVREAVARAQLAYIAHDPDGVLRWAHELRRLGAPLISAYMYGIASLSLQLARRFDDARKTVLAAYEIWEPMNLRHEHFNCHAQLTMVELFQGRPAPEQLEAAHEALRPVDAPGKHVALRMLDAANALVQARQAGDDIDQATRHAREVLAEVRSPGPATPEHPDGEPAWIERSAWVTGCLRVLEDVLKPR